MKKNGGFILSNPFLSTHSIDKLYGDGIQDDYPAIQAMLDSGEAEIYLPAPKCHYCISKALKLHSNQTLRLGETTTVKLLPNSNCFMLTNAEIDAHDIAVIGGIWDFNNKKQEANPIKTRKRFEGPTHLDGNPDTFVSYTEDYRGSVFNFYSVTRLTIRDLTIKDPVTYCVEMAYIKYFTVENINFDQNLGNPTAENMDGIHIDGGCQYGCIRNVQGSCYDDVVALNADDGFDGPIQDIQIDGVFGCNSLRGVRLLSIKSPLERISISNVFGTFYQNCISLSYFYPRSGNRGKMSHITIRNIYGSNAPRIPEYNKGDNSHYDYSFVWIDSTLDIDFLSIDNLFRKEEIGCVETLKVCADTRIKTLSLSNIVYENKIGIAMPMFVNEGFIDKLYLYNVDAGEDRLLLNKGEIYSVKEI